MRRALGASGPRLARQLLIENAAIGLAGGALGLLFALWGRDLMLNAWPRTLPAIPEAPLDLRVLAFAAAVSLVTGLGIGLVPAIQAARGDLQAGLGREQVLGLVSQFSQNGVRRAAVRGEIRVEMKADLLGTPAHRTTLPV